MFLKPQLCGREGEKYYYIQLGRKNFGIHCLVALHYLPNPNDKTDADHINRNKLDNRVENSKWVTREEKNINRNLMKNNSTGLRHIYVKLKKNRSTANWLIYITRSKNKLFYKELSTNKYTLEEVVRIRNKNMRNLE